MTLNINYYVEKHGPWRSRRTLIEQAIRAASPDIVALQAVARRPDMENGRDQASQLAGSLPDYRHFVFLPAMEDSATRGERGSALLSRIPIARIDQHPLTLIPTLEDTDRRTILYAQFDLAGGPLHLFNAHFSWVAQQGGKNVEETLAYLHSYTGPALMVGDLNARPDAAHIQALAMAGWIDVWAKFRPDEPGFTFESSNPTQRIDYAWASADLENRLTGIELVADHADDEGHHASSHFGLVVSVNLDAP